MYPLDDRRNLLLQYFAKKKNLQITATAAESPRVPVKPKIVYFSTKIYPTMYPANIPKKNCVT